MRTGALSLLNPKDDLVKMRPAHIHHDREQPLLALSRGKFQVGMPIHIRLRRSPNHIGRIVAEGNEVSLSEPLLQIGIVCTDERNARVHGRTCIKKGACRLLKGIWIALIEGAALCRFLEKVIERAEQIPMQYSTHHKYEGAMALARVVKTIGTLCDGTDFCNHNESPVWRFVLSI